MRRSYDLIIIGNGILGSAVAFTLRERAPALRIALIGPRDRPGSASQAAGAMLNVFGEVEAGSLAHPLQRYKFALAREALALWPAWHQAIAAAARAPDAPGVAPGTTILRPRENTANYTALRAALDEAGEPYAIIDPGGIEGYRPGAAGAAEAIHIPGEGRVNPRRLLALFERLFAAGGAVSPIEERVASITLGSFDLKSVRLSGGATVTAPKLLIAAGAESGRLIAGIPALRGRVQPLFYGIGAALLFKTSGPAPPHVLRVDHPGFDHGIHLVPQGEGELYVGATSDVAALPESEARPGRVEALREAAAAHFDQALGSLAPHVLLGFRPVTADGFPLIGETSVPGLFVLSGTRRDGLHLSPVYARDMADRILGGAGFITGFEPERVF